MKLEQQVVALVAVMLLLQIGMLGLTSSTLISGTYASLEQRDVVQELQRGEAALEEEQADLTGTVLDWALWDDTYSFSRGESPEYVERNLMLETFQNLDIDTFLIYAPDGTLRYGRALNRSSILFEDAPGSMTAAIADAGLPTRALEADDTVEGLLVVGDRPVLIAAHRILTSTFEGPSPGTLILTRGLDDERMATVGDVVQLPIALVMAPLPDGPGSVVLEGGEALFMPVNASRVSGYFRLRALGGRDLWLRVELPRTIVASGETIKAIFLGALTLTIFLFGLIALVATDRLYLRRIRTITASVEGIGRHTGKVRIPDLPGHDEISSLGTSINGMLDELLAYHGRLTESEARFRAVVEDQTELICRARSDGTLVFANRAFLHFFLLPADAEGRHLDELLPEPLAAVLTGAMGSTSIDCPAVELETSSEHAQGLRQVAWTVRALDGGVCQLVGRDTTLQHEALLELRRYRDELEVLVARRTTECMAMHDRLAASERLEALGVLAGGIAHDFNNLLAAATGNLELIRLELPAHTPVAARLDDLARHLERSTRLTSQLLTFAQGGSPVKRATRIAELVGDTAAFICLGSGVRSVLSAPGGLWTVEVDPDQISQVISNLVLNAVQAMDGRGTIELTLENVCLSGEEGLPLPPGPYLRCEVRDHGPGVPPELLLRIFDPFFTTRPAGTGLGLSTSFSIVRRHGGYLACQSPPDGGAAFVLYLPADPEIEPAGATPRVEAPAVVGPPTRAATARILLMDDEAAIREVTATMLRMNGFQVDSAADGEEALCRYREARIDGRPFDLVITDLTVPGAMGGRELMEHLLALDPSVRAIVSSGYSNDPIMADHAAWGFVGVLPKPYRLAALLDAVRSALPD